MYNAELKEKFLEVIHGDKDKYKTAFNNFADVEEQYDLDLCRMPRIQIIENVFIKGFVEPPTLANYLGCINTYRSWCCNNAIPGALCEPDLNVRNGIDFVSHIVSIIYTDLDQILDDLDRVNYDFDNGDEAAPTLILGWYGLKGKAIASLEEKNVDLETGRVFDNEHHLLFQIDNQRALDALKRYKSSETATRGYNGGEAFLKTTGYFIHKMGRRNEHKSGPVLERQLNRKIEAVRKLHEKHNKAKCERISLKYAFRSGTLYRLRQFELNGANFDDEQNHQSVLDIYGSPNGQLQYILFYYEQYKKAFNLP